ncbi:MAG TPA: hypothetical protein PLP64_10765 [Pseudothermotoga sp.]|nr:hypothetical protein [Pseudothermotoga sp.]HOK84687.1 hypothetical protein [Pseudothermotoga sp.]HPP71214.1 hypothetical protein [Pseudothermotoga sp.]
MKCKDLCERLDALIEKEAPETQGALKGLFAKIIFQKYFTTRTEDVNISIYDIAEAAHGDSELKRKANWIWLLAQDYEVHRSATPKQIKMIKILSESRNVPLQKDPALMTFEEAQNVIKDLYRKPKAEKKTVALSQEQIAEIEKRLW